jgi:hypothetical protein
MPAWFYDLNIVVALLTMYVIFGFVSYLGYFFYHTYFKSNDIHSTMTIAAQTSMTFGSLFIALWITLNWNTLANLKLYAKNEAQAVLIIYFNSFKLNENSAGEQIRTAVDQYLNNVIVEAYPLLASNQPDKISDRYLNQLTWAITGLSIKNAEDKVTYTELSNNFNRLIEVRLERLSKGAGSMHGALLIFFIVLLVIICFWIGFVQSKNRLLTIMVISSQQFIIISFAWLMLELDCPFEGYFGVDSSAFVHAQQLIQESRPFLLRRS